MDANQIILWNSSWWGMKLMYENDDLVSVPTQSNMESFMALMHSVFARNTSWFCCNPYNKHDVNFPSDALLAYLEQKDVKQCYSTKEQRKATEIAIRALWRVCGTNPNYVAYHPRKKRMNQRVVDAVERIVLHIAKSDASEKKVTKIEDHYDCYPVNVVLNYLNDEGYSRTAIKAKQLAEITEGLF